MKHVTFVIHICCLCLGTLSISIPADAQSLKDLFNRENVEKAIHSISGKNTADMIGVWNYAGTAVEFQSSSILQKAGGALAASAAEDKLNEQLEKIGIKEGGMSFSFNADSTFTLCVGKKKMEGTYAYDESAQKVDLKFSKLFHINTKVNCTSSELSLLFNTDKLLDLFSFIANQSDSSTWQALGSLSENYDGMMMGFTLKKTAQ